MRGEPSETELRKFGFAVCLTNEGYAVSLEVRKLYPFISDPDAEANQLIRIVDESGHGYLYPAKLFRKLATRRNIVSGSPPQNGW